MNQVAHMQELSRRIMATRLAPRRPFWADISPYRDSAGIRWVCTQDVWAIDFRDPGSRAGLIERLPKAILSQSGLRYYGEWRGYATPACETWEDAVTLLYEAYELGMLSAA